MPADAVDRLLFDLLQAFATPVSLSDVRREKIAGVMARSGAKGAGRTLSREEAAALLAQLADLGSRRGVALDQQGLDVSRELVSTQLKALAAQRLFGVGAYFQVVNPRMSPAYRQAVEILKNWDEKGNPLLEPKK